MSIRHQRARFLGRAPELAALGQAFERARAGAPELVVIVGDAGIGKTRLVQESCRHLDALLLEGGCVDLGSGVLPYGPVVEALRSLQRSDALGSTDRVPAVGDRRPASATSTSRVQRHLTGLGRLLPALAGGGGHPDGDRTALFSATVALFEQLAGQRPVVLVVEDAHWADRSTLDLLSYLVQSMSRCPVLVLVTVRREGLDPELPTLRWLSEVTRSARASRLDLAAFTYDEVREQLTALLGARPDDHFLDSIFSRSDGNAFFVEELVALRSGATELPPSLGDVLAAQLVRLSPKGRAVLGVAAAVGRNVDHDLLVRVADLSQHDLLGGLREAVDRHVLVSDHRGVAYRFRHALLREAVHASLLPGERVELHRRIATALTADPALASLGPAQATLELAHHWLEARDLDRAFTAALAASAVAEAASAYAEALTHLECALELRPRIGADTVASAPPRHELLSAASRVAYLAGEHRRSLAHTAAALAELGAHEDTRKCQAQLHKRMSELRWGLGHGAAALAAAQEAVAAAGSTPSEVLAEVLGWQSRLSMLLDRHQEAVGPAERAIAIARDLDVPVAEGFARNSLGCALAGLGDPGSGLVHLREALELATEAGALDDIVRARNNLAAVAGWAGRYEDVVAEARAGLAWGEGRRLRSGAFVSLGLNGVEALLLLGRYDEAEALLAATPLPADEPVIRAMHRRAAAWLALDRGDLEPAVTHLAEAESLLSGDTDAMARASLATFRAELELANGRALEAFTQVEPARKVVTAWNIDASPAPAWRVAGAAAATMAAQARDLGQRQVTADLGARLDDLLAACRHTVAHRPPSFLRRSLEQAVRQLEAERTWVLGAPDPAAFEAALIGSDELPPIAAGRLLLRLAETRVAVDDRAGAAASAAEALAVGRRIGAHVLEARVLALGRRGRLELEPAATPDVVGAEAATFRLTEREREVLALVADGRSNGEIGAALCITTKTASAHVSNILAKLGVAKRGEAAAVAHRLGLVTEEGHEPTARGDGATPGGRPPSERTG
jgi:DNA-binding CsgD family transcriptional regulator/tetratricopeptide (TPR) repeat protein